jgi:hypothetical protein
MHYTGQRILEDVWTDESILRCPTLIVDFSMIDSLTLGFEEDASTHFVAVPECIIAQSLGLDLARVGFTLYQIIADCHIASWIRGGCHCTFQSSHCVLYANVF